MCKLKKDRQHNGQNKKTDNTMAKTKTILKTLHGKLKIEQHKPTLKQGVNLRVNSRYYYHIFLWKLQKYCHANVKMQKYKIMRPRLQFILKQLEQDVNEIPHIIIQHHRLHQELVVVIFFHLAIGLSPLFWCIASD